MSNTDYVLLNFNELNEKGLMPLTKAMAKNGYEIAKVVPAGNARKKDGIMIRSFTLIGMDEQVMNVQVNDTGDISVIRLNGKTAPYQAVKNLAALAKSLADLFSRGATAFQKALARKIARAAKKNIIGGEKNRPTVKSGVQLLAEAKASHDEMRENIALAKKRIADLQVSNDRLDTETQAAENEQTTEKARGRQLKEEIAQLEEVV